MKDPFHKNFGQLFFRRELAPLAGKGFSNLFILIMMLFVAFSVIGFAEGSLRYLESKMRDPFINWVTVIPQPHRGIPVHRVLDELNSEQVRNEYNLRNAIGFNRIQYNFYDYNDIQSYYQTGEINYERIFPFPARTMDVADPVLEEVFAPANHIRGEHFVSERDAGLIVTADMLSRLNYPENTPYVWMDFLAYRTSDMADLRVTIPVEVKAVVRHLPGLAMWGASTFFNQQRSYHFISNPFNPMNDNRMVMAFHGNGEKAAELVDAIENVLRHKTAAFSHELNTVWSEPRYDDHDRITRYLIFASFRPREISIDLLDEIFHKLYNHDRMTAFRQDLFRLYDYETRFRSLQTVDEYDRISLNFNNLDKLRAFSVLLQENYNLQIDMAQIESRENYNFISRLTGIISLVLIGFSILSILLFMSYLLKRHLESIRRNLGTFKAFGLSNAFLTDIYVKLVLFILGIATLTALLLSAVFGYAGGMRMVLYFLGSAMESGKYFSLMSSYMVIALVLLTVFSVIVLRAVSLRILNNTPGDLIYERE